MSTRKNTRSKTIKGIEKKVMFTIYLTIMFTYLSALSLATVFVSSSKNSVLEATYPDISKAESKYVMSVIEGVAREFSNALERNGIGADESAYARATSINGMVNDLNYVSKVGVLNSNGSGYYSDGTLANLGSMSFYKKNVGTNSTLITAESNGNEILYISKRDGSFITFAAFDKQAIADLLATVDFEENASVYMLNSNNEIINLASSMNVKNFFNLSDENYEKLTNGEYLSFSTSEDFLAQCIDNNGVKLLFVAPKSSFTTFNTGQLIVGFILVIVLFTFSSLVNKAVIRSIVKPLISLTDNTKKISISNQYASQKVSESSEVLAAGSEQQASEIEEMSASIEETNSMVYQISEGAKKIADLAQTAKSRAENGNVMVQNMVSNINDIKDSSDNISKIIKVIDDIASQTNILALNAAVEAARAGDAGKGFAVVAEEVRALAQKSAEAAKSTGTIIESNIELSEKGVVLSTKVAEEIERIVTDIDGVARISAESATACDEQAKGIEQLTLAMKSIEQSVQSNAESAQTNAGLSTELKSSAEDLNQIASSLTSVIIGEND